MFVWFIFAAYVDLLVTFHHNWKHVYGNVVLSRSLGGPLNGWLKHRFYETGIAVIKDDKLCQKNSCAFLMQKFVLLIITCLKAKSVIAF